MRRGLELDPKPIWTGALLDLFDLMTIDPGLVRTNLSRLVANGTLLRTRQGRNTFYSLSDKERLAFTLAAEVIYGRLPLVPTGQITMVSVDACADRVESRVFLQEQGFKFIGPSTGLLPAYENLAPPLREAALYAIATPSPWLAESVRTLWDIDHLGALYRQFLETYEPLAHATDISPQDAVVGRVILTHEYRRIVLRDPCLPAALLPADWPAGKAREVFDHLTARLETGSEHWLAQTSFRKVA